MVHIPCTDDQVTLGLSAWRAIAFFTALELFGRLEIHMTETGAQTTVDSVMALGYAMSKNYATLAPKVECRAARYSVQVAAGGDE